MQVTLKPLKGETFEVEVSPQDSIGALKQKIAELKAEMPAEIQKLIYKGKILTDDATVEASAIKEGEFVVVMVAKAKAKEPTAAAAPAPAPAATAPAPASGAAPDEAMPDAAAQAAASVVTGAGQRRASKGELCNMGFERPQVERCLQAAFGNPDRAVEYLMNGIPAGLAGPPEGAAPVPGGAGGPPAAGGAALPPGAAAFPAMPAGGGGGGAEVPPELARLRTNPQFPQLARMVAQNPQMLAQILPALGQTDPQAMQAVMANPQAFMRMIR
ncbi:unnamed protein product, partial [Prorocentrum cordatum]